MRTSFALLTIISFQIVLSRPPVPKYDLNSDLTDSQLSKLEPEKELDIGDRDFALSEGTSSNGTGKDSDETEHKRHSEANDAENEIEDVDYDTGDYDSDYHSNEDNKNNDLQTVLTSFLMFIPKNSTMADLFNTVAQMFDDPSTNSTDCSKELLTR